METENRLVVARIRRRSGDLRVTVGGCGVSLEGNENVLKLIVVVISQLRILLLSLCG